MEAQGEEGEPAVVRPALLLQTRNIQIGTSRRRRMTLKGEEGMITGDCHSLSVLGQHAVGQKQS